MAAKKSPPWKRKRPSGPAAHLTSASKKRAKAAAKKAGRRYPNLVDNMREATKQKSRKKRL
jgi:ribosomal protein L15E